MAPPPRLAVHFSQFAITTSLVSLAIEYAERAGQRTILGLNRPQIGTVNPQQRTAGTIRREHQRGPAVYPPGRHSTSLIFFR
jgi:hypothetical protein